ncbi:FkbM family methyltransferase [Tateyamaria sp. SN6-1]|uniref:FkbM family methyltransferase n=1 Tax=Tateyamaria sp. SN6-1 TaxID=3092148 RepID=UPI0039F470C0
MHDPIFDRFERVTTTGTGAHMHDFVGAITRVAFKSAWTKYAVPEGQAVTPGYPPKNEHYLDWIATLRAVDKAQGTFRMAELGAGWAPWLVSAALAARQKPEITALELVGVEADPQHYEWMRDHMLDNGIDPGSQSTIFGAASNSSDMLRFPVIDNPDVNYGASLRAVYGDVPFIEVPGVILETVLNKFSGPVDFLHVDIQGAEYDLIPAEMDLLTEHVKSIMVGTHIDMQKHDDLAALFRDAGWVEAMNFERNSLNQTPYGQIKFDDGFLLFTNPALQ